MVKNTNHVFRPTASSIPLHPLPFSEAQIVATNPLLNKTVARLTKKKGLHAKNNPTRSPPCLPATLLSLVLKYPWTCFFSPCWPLALTLLSSPVNWLLRPDWDLDYLATALQGPGLDVGSASQARCTLRLWTPRVQSWTLLVWLHPEAEEDARKDWAELVTCAWRGFPLLEKHLQKSALLLLNRFAEIKKCKDNLVYQENESILKL